MTVPKIPTGLLPLLALLGPIYSPASAQGSSYQQALQLLDKGQGQAAEQLARSALQSGHKSAKTYQVLARAQGEQWKLTQACTNLRNAWNLDKGSTGYKVASKASIDGLMNSNPARALALLGEIEIVNPGQQTVASRAAQLRSNLKAKGVSPDTPESNQDCVKLHQEVLAYQRSHAAASTKRPPAASSSGPATSTQSGGTPSSFPPMNMNAPVQQESFWTKYLPWLLPIVALLGVWFFRRKGRQQRAWQRQVNEAYGVAGLKLEEAMTSVKISALDPALHPLAAQSLQVMENLFAELPTRRDAASRQPGTPEGEAALNWLKRIPELTTLLSKDADMNAAQAAEAQAQRAQEARHQEETAQQAAQQAANQAYQQQNRTTSYHNTSGPIIINNAPYYPPSFFWYDPMPSPTFRESQPLLSQDDPSQVNASSWDDAPAPSSDINRVSSDTWEDSSSDSGSSDSWSDSGSSDSGSSDSSSSDSGSDSSSSSSDW